MRLLLASFLFGCALALAAEATLAPNSPEFHKLYGDPASAWNWDGNPDSEGFNLQPNVHLTVMYGKDHRACHVQLEPKIPTYTEEQYYLMSTERVSAILDEIAPTAKRGKLPALPACSVQGTLGLAFTITNTS